MNELLKEEHFENLIYEIRGKAVMLSSDIARIYQVETKVLNQTIKRNINRFPESFCFQLTEKELDEISLRSQFVTLNKSNNLRGQHYKYLPYVLTEQGIMMLSGLLKSDIAVKVNIKVIDAFVKMRHMINIDNNMLVNHEKRLLKVEETLDKMQSKEKSIIYENTIYDAYSLLIDIFNEAKDEIVIIDNYANKELFDILRNISKKIIVISKNIDDILKGKYEKEYNNVEFINDDTFHDRYIILDNKEIYISGMSLKDVGKKYSYIYKLNEKILIEEIIRKVKEIIN